MSLVDSTTGEIVDEVIPPMDAAEARRHVEKMRGSLAITAEQVLEAWQRQAFKPLGYKNWEAFLDGEFPDFGLNAVARNALMVGLRNTGMSLRQIARTTGASRNTVAAQVAQIEPPETVVGGDGKSYPASQPERTSDDGGVPVSESSDHPPTAATDSGDGSSRPAPSSDHLEDPAGESSTGEGEDRAVTPSPDQRSKDLAEVGRRIKQVSEFFSIWSPEELHALNDPKTTESVRLAFEVISPWWAEYKQTQPRGLHVVNGVQR